MSLLLRFLGIDAARPGAEASDSEALHAIARQLESLPAERARFFAAFTYVLARVAGADLRIEDDECEAMKKQLVRVAGVGAEEADLVVSIARTHADRLGGTENYLVTRAFRRMSTKADRLRLLDCLFAVAAADDVISGSESTEIMNIAQELGIERDDAIAARARFRDKLAEFRKLRGEQA